MKDTLLPIPRQIEMSGGTFAPTAAALRRELDRDMGEFITEYQQAWLARNRPGGLVDSVARLEKLREDYD
jgi:hypothetical protein